MNFITWLYFLEEKKNKKDIFLYGFSLPTSHQPTLPKQKTLRINKKKKILLFTTISSTLPQITKNFLSFDGFMRKEKYKTDIVSSEKTILVDKNINKVTPFSFLGYPIYADTFYTKEIHDYIHNYLTTEELNSILKKLSDISGLPFNDIYAKKLGCYEVGKVFQRVEHKNIQYIDCKINRNENKREYWFIKDKSIDYGFTIHLIIYNEDNEILYDFIDTILKDGDSKKLITTNLNEDAGFEYWIFDKENNLIDRRKINFAKKMNLVINFVEGQYIVPKETFNKKNPLYKEDRKVQIYTPYSNQTFQVTKENINIKSINKELFKNLKEYNQKDNIFKYGKWFNKENYKELINFFNEITKNGNYELVFIDPFISSSACLDYLYHLKNTNITFTFISCWAYNVSPDDKKNETISQHISKFKNVLDNLQDYKLPLKNSTWYNLKEKSFHDRYLYVKNLSTNEILIFSISNSLNNLLSNYDNLLILPLHGKPCIEAKNYIENVLLPKCNEENKIYPDGDKE